VEIPSAGYSPWGGKGIKRMGLIIMQVFYNKNICD
jgi:hypothetical protein